MNDKIKTICLLILFFFMLSNLGANMEEHKELPAEIFKHWVHSHEDDTEDIKVYRPADYKFPPSRGREGFEIKQNGEFILYRIAPTDGLRKLTGHWKSEGKNKIIVSFEEHEVGSYTINIVLCSKDILKIKKRS
jgi:hypothetical protein